MTRDPLELLQKRALMISRRQSDPEGDSRTIMVVEFLLTPEQYAVDTSFVTEVLPLRNLTLIPGTPPYVVGIMNVRGKIISIVNLKSFFNLAQKGLSSQNRVIVLRHQEMEFGIVTDCISATRRIDTETLSKPPASRQDPGSDYIRGITAEGLILLNAEALLSSKAIVVNQK